MESRSRISDWSQYLGQKMSCCCINRYFAVDKQGFNALRHTTPSKRMATNACATPALFHSHANMPIVKTEFQAFGVSWSPFEETRLAVATAQNFGIVGNGKLEVFENTPRGLAPMASFYTRDALYEVAWSEQNENHIIGGCGDGSVKLWDVTLAQKPLRSFEEHSQECASVDWNPHTMDGFISASWDNSLKLWSPHQGQSLRTWREHVSCVYACRWAPHERSTIATCSGDQTVKIWDVRGPRSSGTWRAHENEVLTLDWNKYNPNVLATGSVDKTIRIWDVRTTHKPLRVLYGHGWGVKKVKFSPHHETQLASCSYDMSVAIWDTVAQEPRRDRMEHHTEFAAGVDFNIFVEGLVASCGWDSKVFVWRLGQDPLRS